MSLQHVAHHLKTKGRGPDTELVHMTKREVAGLQALAQSQGKTLTINPHTGLPEAGILRAILPAVTTAAATYFGGPQAGTAVAAAWGVKTYMDTGSLTKGLMTGIGAYGGSQLAAGMTAEMGTSALGQTAGASTSGTQAALADAGTTTAASNAANSATNAITSGSSATGVGTTGANVVDAGLANTGWYDAGLGSTTANPNLLSSTSEGVVDAATKTSEAGATSGQTAKDFDLTKMRMPTSPTTDSQDGQYSYKLSAPKTSYADLQGAWQAEPVADTSIPGSTADYRLSQGVDYSLKPVSTQPTGINQLPNASPQGQPAVDNWKQFQKNATMKNIGMAMAPMMIQDKKTGAPSIKGDSDMGQRYAYSSGFDPKAGLYVRNDLYRPVSATEAKALYGYAEGGEVAPAGNMAPASSAANGPAIGAMSNNTGIATVAPTNGYAYDAANGGQTTPYAEGGDVQGDPNLMQVRTYDPVVRMAGGGIYNLGGYSDGGRLLKGPGDGVSDSIPATIGGKQPARLADGEFVVPARIVSELGNGSTDAGARQLYKMMDRVQKARSKTTAKGKMAKNTNAAKYLPA